MANVNISTVHFLNVPLDKDKKHTIYFNSKDEQFNYFWSQRKKSFDDFTYISEDSAFLVDIPYDTAKTYNYLMYQNTANSNKWYYAFITDYKSHSSGDSTKFTFEIDPIQTRLGEYEVLPSFIDREHTNLDRVGRNTVPENLETGEYVCEGVKKNRSLNYIGYVVAATIDLYEDKFPAITGAVYNGIFSGICYFYFGDTASLQAKIKAVAEGGKSDGIISIFVVPSHYVKPLDWKGGFIIEPSNTPVIRDWATAIDLESSDSLLNAPDNLEGYVPKNKKLLTYPYCYMLASNNAGAANVYQWEHFPQDTQGKITADFEIWSTVTPGMSIRLVPKHYKGAQPNNEEGLNLGKFPICAWATDVYTNWLTQNSLNIGVNIVGGAMSIIGGVAMGVATGGIGAAISAGGVMGGVSQITNQLTQIHQQSFQSPTAQGNLNSGDVTFSKGFTTFCLYSMTIKSEYARIIDDYFDKYGYKSNQIKVPYKNHRKYWWYTKTVDVNIKDINGTIPQDELQEIKDCYNNGITFWRNTADSPIKEYAGLNDII